MAQEQGSAKAPQGNRGERGALTAGKTLSENWSSPLVDTVTLPAHAQTTGPAAVTLQFLSPFQSANEVPLVFNEADGVGGQLVELDASDDSQDWDTLPDSQILDFFARSAHAWTGLNAASHFEMVAQVNGTTANLCIQGLTTAAGSFHADLYGTPVIGNTIVGGVADASIVDELVFNDFQLIGNNLSGSFDITVNSSSTTVTDVSVVLSPGGIGCESEF